MAEHVWSVLCRKGVQDRETNLISLLEVPEKITARGMLDLEEEIAAGRTLLPVQLELVSWWVRSDFRQEEESAGRFLMIAPDHQEVGRLDFPIDLTGSHTGRRTIAKVTRLPIDKGTGLFWSVVELQRGEGWTAVARIPLELEIVPEEESQE